MGQDKDMSSLSSGCLAVIGVFAKQANLRSGDPGSVSNQPGLGPAEHFDAAGNVMAEDSEAAIRAEIENVLEADASVLREVYRGGLSEEELRENGASRG